MKIFIFTEFYYPNLVSSGYYLTKVAEHLSLTNDVTVITTGDNSFATINNVKVFRIKTKPFNKYNLFKRAFAFVRISLSFYNHAVKLNINKNDNVFCVTNPALFIPVIALLKKKINFKLTILVHDVFPENLVATNIISNKNPIYQILLWLYNKSYEKSDQIIVCGRDMKLLFQKKLNKFNGTIKFIPNWADTKSVYPNSSNKNKQLIFQYAGNIGRAQGIPNLIEAVAYNKSLDFELHFYGKGPLLKKIIDLNISNIIYKGTFTRKESNKYLNLCDVAIVTLEKKMLGLGVPSKTYNILSAGKPIFYIGDKDSEISILVNEFKVGYSVEPENNDKIIEGLKWFLNLTEKQLDILKSNSRKLVVQHFSEEKVLTQYSESIK